ncbi:MAG: SIS domain-containing protein [Acidobacteria bacterium]|nr:SIS domain-containing protein [Acidobacteriota bacterium]MBI3658417.1 SIS domain-containing protein [Acidobacteriota bacterium]
MSIMLDEIREQPQVLRKTFIQGWRDVQPFRRFASRSDFRIILIVARGTSDNAAMFGRYLFEATTGIPVSLIAPSIHTLYKSSLRLSNALVIGISQSGEGTDVNLVLESCKAKGAFTVGITNEPDSKMARLVDEVFLVGAGKERSVAATKTYTGQLLLLYLVAWALGAALPADQTRRIPDLAETALDLEKNIAALVERYRFMNQCAVVARGLNYANAYELALKLMETSYVVAERFSSADFLHGPIAMVDRSFPLILFMPPGPTYKGLCEMLRTLQSLNADTLVISSVKVLRRSCRRLILVPGSIKELYTPIPYIIPGQLFAALLARAKGLNPDRPRALSKITRTV